MESNQGHNLVESNHQKKLIWSQNFTHKIDSLQSAGIRGRIFLRTHPPNPSQSMGWKGSTTTTGPASYLLGVNELHQWHHQYLGLVDYMPGPANMMADDLLHLWALNDSQLLPHSIKTYPQMQP